MFSVSSSAGVAQKAALGTALILLVFSLGCGNSSTTNVPVKGNFTNASLQGQYAYVLNGSYFGSTVTNGPFREAGTFTADGNGNITTGQDDFVQGGAPFSTAVTGTYSLNNDGTGFITLNLSGGSIVLAATLITDSKLYLIEADSFANGSGVAERQDSTAFSAAPSGTFTFRTHSSSASGGSVGSVGTLTVTAGAITGTEDVLRASALLSPTLTGSISAPNTSGRGTMSLTDSTGSTSGYIYYVVNASTFNLLESDAGPLGSGRAEKQSGGPFTPASLSGGFAFGSAGDTTANTGGVDTVGAFTSSGSGTITAGSFDAVQDGNPTVDATLTGTYTMSSSGRAAVAFNQQSGATVQRIFWMVSPARAFFLVDDPSKVEDGTADQQTTTSFSNSTVNGQYAFFMDGFDSVSPPLVDRVGTLNGDGSGNLQLNYFVNRTGITNAPGFLTGTYSVGSNGRVAGSVSALSTNIVLYMFSSSNGYLLLADPGAQLEGAAGVQTSP